jgi:hypothetical protein
LTPEVRNTQLLAFYAVANGTNLSQPTGMTQRWVVNSQSTPTTNRVTAAFNDQVLAASGPTGSRTSSSTPPAAADSVSQLVSVTPVDASAPAPVYRGVKVKFSPAGGATELSVASPTETVVGDEMFAQIALRGVAATVAPPPGWTLVSAMSQGSSVKSLIYEKTATIAGTAGATHTWVFSAATEAAGGIVAYGGASKSYSATDAPAGSLIQYWDGTTFTTTCPTPDANTIQRVPLQFVSLDQRATETIVVVKRCHEKKAPTSVCEDS